MASEEDSVRNQEYVLLEFIELLEIFLPSTKISLSRLKLTVKVNK